MNGICNGNIFGVPTPWGGAKRSNIIKSELLSQFQRFLYQTLNERFIKYQTGFSFGRLGHAQRWDFGVPWGVGGQKNFFLKLNQIWSELLP